MEPRLRIWVICLAFDTYGFILLLSKFAQWIFLVDVTFWSLVGPIRVQKFSQSHFWKTEFISKFSLMMTSSPILLTNIISPPLYTAIPRGPHGLISPGWTDFLLTNLLWISLSPDTRKLINGNWFLKLKLNMPNLLGHISGCFIRVEICVVWNKWMEHEHRVSKCTNFVLLISKIDSIPLDFH